MRPRSLPDEKYPSDRKSGDLHPTLQLGPVNAGIAINPTLLMKTKPFIFSLVSLSLTALSATAASPSVQPEPVQVLPAYVVQASRQSPAEKEISRSLAALRAVAARPVAIKVSVALPKAMIVQVPADKKSPMPVVVVAGL